MELIIHLEKLTVSHTKYLELLWNLIFRYRVYDSPARVTQEGETRRLLVNELLWVKQFLSHSSATLLRRDIRSSRVPILRLRLEEL
jgi:hypothetical protein